MGDAGFDLEKVRKGYALNKLFHSLNKAENRKSFLADEDGYCTLYGLDAEQREAVRSGHKGQIKAAGGNQYFIAKYDRTLRLGGDPRRAEAPTDATTGQSKPGEG